MRVFLVNSDRPLLNIHQNSDRFTAEQLLEKAIALPKELLEKAIAYSTIETRSFYLVVE